jgi:hypothetical protein
MKDVPKFKKALANIIKKKEEKKYKESHHDQCKILGIILLI